MKKKFKVKANIHGNITINECKEKAITIFKETDYGFSDVTEINILPLSTKDCTVFEIHGIVEDIIDAEDFVDAISKADCDSLALKKLSPDVEIAECCILEIHQENTENIYTDKKHNIRYWDSIDDATFEFVKHLINMSASKDFTADDSDYDIDNEILEVYKAVLDTAINELEERGYEFPYVDKNY